MAGYFLLGMLIMVSCKKDRRQELFRITYPPPPLYFDVLPGLNTLETHIFTLSPVPSGYATALQNSGFTEGDVKSLEPRSAYLSTVFEDINLDFIHRVSILIFDPFNPSDKIEFLYLDPVPFRDKTGIQLFPGIADISEWVKEDYFGLEIRLNFREVTPSLSQMKLEFELRALGE